jgi:nitrogen fixation protein FixH
MDCSGNLYPVQSGSHQLQQSALKRGQWIVSREARHAGAAVRWRRYPHDSPHNSDLASGRDL